MYAVRPMTNDIARATSSRSISVQKWITALCVIAWFLLPSLSHAVEASGGLAGKLIVRYQGWFGCPNDFENNKDWQHWFMKGVQPENFTVDLLPLGGSVSRTFAIPGCVRRMERRLKCFLRRMRRSSLRIFAGCGSTASMVQRCNGLSMSSTFLKRCAVRTTCSRMSAWQQRLTVGFFTSLMTFRPTTQEKP